MTTRPLMVSRDSSASTGRSRSTRPGRCRPAADAVPRPPASRPPEAATAPSTPIRARNVRRPMPSYADMTDLSRRLNRLVRYAPVAFSNRRNVTTALTARQADRHDPQHPAAAELPRPGCDTVAVDVTDGKAAVSTTPQ